jgi:hypothetical protein
MEGMNIAQRVKDFSGIMFGVVIVLGLLAIPALFILGSTWAAKNLLGPLMIMGWIAIALDVAIFLPLTIFRKTRAFAGSMIFLSSFIFGLITWLLGFILTYALWGVWAVIIGIVFLGGAVVPFALLATMFNGMWEPFFSVLVLLVVTFGTRLFGLYLADA